MAATSTSILPEAGTLLEGQIQVLERIARGAPLPAVLRAIVLLVERHAPGVMGSVLLLDRDGTRLRLGAAPSLAPGMIAALDGLVVGPRAGSCGAAAYRNAMVVTQDVLIDPLWEPYRDLASEHGFRSCCSTPINGHGNAVLGTFAVYAPEPRRPSAEELGLIGVATHLAGIVIESRRAEEELRQSERRLREAQRVARLGSWEWEPDAGIVNWSAEMYELHGVSPAEFTPSAEAIQALIVPDDRALAVQLTERCVMEGRPMAFDLHIQRPDGRIRVLYCRGQPVVHETDGRRTTRLVGTAQDVTERRRTEERLRESQRRLRTLTAHREAILEEERARISREIHDELGEVLTAAKLDLAWIRDSLPRASAGIGTRLDELSGRLDTTVKIVRRIATELRPVVLDQLGLAAATEWQVRDFARRTGLACSARAELGDLRLPRETATGLFRILQEALTNIARHAQASMVRVDLRAVQDTVCLEVEDDGRGIDDPEAAGPDTLGLLGMRERVLLLGGALELSALEPSGTRLSVWAPVPA